MLSSKSKENHKYFEHSASLLRMSADKTPHLSANVNGDADDHGGNSDAGDESDANRSSDQGPQLPQDLLLPAPRLLSPERAAGWTKTGRREGNQGQMSLGKHLRASGLTGSIRYLR